MNKTKQLMYTLLLITSFHSLLLARSMDTLIDKLVEKNVITSEDKKDLLDKHKNKYKKKHPHSFFLYGDMRTRFQSEDVTGAGDSSPNRNRIRLRTRLKAKYIVNESTTVYSSTFFHSTSLSSIT